MAIVKDIDITPEQRQLVCSIFATHLPDTEVWAYGSRVHWNATPSSDLDLVAFCSDKSGLANCRDAFAESSLPFRVDLFLWDEIPENFQDRIKQEYAVLMPKQEVKWKYIPMRVFCTRVADGTHATPKPVNAGKKLVTSKNIVKGKLSLEDCYCISQDDFDEINRRSKVDLGDVLLSMIGTVGATCVIEIESDFAIKNVALLKNKDLLHGKYLNYYLSTSEGQLLIRERLRGTTQQYIPLEDVRNLPIKVPCNPDKMKEIVNVLSAFDDKIELNRKMSKMLEAMAEALFKSWFVDFEPVRAKIAAIKNGKDPELAAIMSISGKTEVQLAEMKTFYPDAYSELAHTASLFPSTMVENEDFYEIPEDWDIYNFSDILQESKEKCGDLDVPEFSVTDNGIVPRNEKFKKNLSASKNKNKLLCKNQLVFGMSREILNWGIMADEIGGVSSVYNVFNVSSDIDPEYLRMFITNQLIYFKDLIKPAAREGQSIDRKVLMQKKIYIPIKKLLEYWLKLHSTMNNRMKWLMEQQQTHLKQQENILQHIFTTEES